MLWLALLFPQLPIDRQEHSDADSARAVILQEGPRRRVLACNRVASDAGIRPGLALKNAYAIVPDLQVSDYDEDEQQAHLAQLTLWALNYSSWVSPEPPNTIVLEVAASLKLFDGLDTLLERLEAEAQALGITLRIGVAPTPTAASLLARAGITTAVQQLSELPDAINNIPVTCLPLDEFIFKGLRQSGIRNLGELMAIPAAAMTRRFGHQCTDLLYRLDARLPDPRPAYKLSDSFCETMDLPLEAPDTAAIAFPLNRLLGALSGFLKSHDLGVRHLDITLYHHRRQATVVALKFLDATANTTHLFRVATERLGAIALSAPIIRIQLNATELASIEREGKDLLQKSQAQNSSIQQMIDKLTARLGKEALYTALPDNDHRPEKAWLSALLESSKAPLDWPARPLWLLATPVPATQDLDLQTLPERIENGWWDEVDVRRDYHLARRPDGSYCWVYQLRHAPGEFWVHGLFA